MNVVVIKNIAAEGPGTIEHHLQQRSIPYEIVDLHCGDSVPEMERFSHVVIMGAPWRYMRCNSIHSSQGKPR